MNGRRLLLFLVFSVVLILGASIYWFMQPSGEKASAQDPPAADINTGVNPGVTASDLIKLSPEALTRGGITSTPATRHLMQRSLVVTGRVQINEDASARVGSPVEGRVTRVMATVGDRVRENQPLVYIHSHELIEARADYAKATANLNHAEKTVRYAQAEAERAKRLLEAKAISQREHLRAVADVAAAETELEQAQAELHRVKEFLDHLGASPEEHDELAVRAPIDGVITERNVTIGTVVNPSTDLIVISNLSTVWVIAEVPERSLPLVQTGQAAEISVAAHPDERFSGRVVYLGESLDPETRTMRVRCLVQNPFQRLRSEMYATISIDTGFKPGVNGTPSVLVVPREAVHEIEGERVVFIDLGGGAIRKRIVQTGETWDEFVEITGGLEEGERVVTRGSFLIKTEFLKAMIEEG